MTELILNCKNIPDIRKYGGIYIKTSKKASMQEAAERQLKECEFIESGEEKKKCQDETNAAIKTIEETSDRGSKTVYDGDRVVGSDVRLMGQHERQSLVEGASLLGKLPGSSATKGDDYAKKARKGKVIIKSYTMSVKLCIQTKILKIGQTKK